MVVLEAFRTISDRTFDYYTYFGDLTYDFFSLHSRDILNVLHIFFKQTFNILLYITIVFTTMYLVMSIIVAFKKKQKESAFKFTKYPFVTIQIPTYNELAAINCARKALEFDYPKNRYEIILGDDSSDKKVSKQIDEFASKHKGIIKVTRRGANVGFKPGNLNHMLKYTKGEFIVIFDSDFLPKKDFLRRIIVPFVKDKRVDGVQARWVIKNFSQNFPSIIGGIIPMFSHHLGLPFFNFVKSNGFIAGSAEAVRKKTLVKLGGWQSGALTEDIEYSLRLTSLGRKIVYLENLRCDCEAPFTVKDLCKQQMRWSYGVISALKKHLFPIFTSRKIRATWKINPVILGSGYLVSLFFFLLFVTGFLSIITNEPQPIDWARFFSETGRNILLTSGYLFTSLIILKLGKRFNEAHRLIVASFSVGLLVIYTVTVGVFKAIFNRNMEWFMLAKKGNIVKSTAD